MVRSFGGRMLVVLGVAAGLAVGAVAIAGADDRATAESLLKEVETSPRKDVAAPLAARSRTALERASQLRVSGDEAHARLADSLARRWAEAARDAARAAVVEESAAAARRSAADAGALADRERALLEEAIAQSGRLRAQLESAQHEGKDQPARTSTAAVNGDAGARPAGGSKATAKDAGAPPPAKTTSDGGAR
jgi:hypothetical protein